MRKFISILEYSKKNNVGVSAVNHRIRSEEIPQKYLRFIKSIYSTRLVQGIREDYVVRLGRRKSTYDHRELTHTVYLPGGIKKVLQPHEYKNNRWKNRVVVQ